MKAVITVLIVGMLSACASAPEQKPAQTDTKHEVICSGGAMALIALTKPWGLKECVSGNQ